MTALECRWSPGLVRASAVPSDGLRGLVSRRSVIPDGRGNDQGNPVRHNQTGPVWMQRVGSVLEGGGAIAACTYRLHARKPQHRGGGVAVQDGTIAELT